MTNAPKGGKRKILVLVLIFVVLLILLVPVVPVQSKVQKENVATQTLTQTRTILQTTSQTTLVPLVTTSRVVAIEPEKYDVKTEWQVTWYTVTGEGRIGASVGTQTFPAIFSYDWGRGVVFQQYSDFIMFQATSTINVQRSGPVRFSVTSDDGVRLYVDGQLTIDKYDRPLFSPHQQSVVVNLAPGTHTLRLDWYEWDANARITFSTDQDVVAWSDTRTVTKTQTQIITTSTASTITQTSTSFSPFTTTTVITKTVTVDQTNYVSILQLLLGI